MNNIILKNLMKTFAPNLGEVLSTAQEGIIDYFNQQKLEPGESHIAAVTDVDAENKKIYIVIAAFKDKEFSRAIEAMPMEDFVKKLLSQVS